MQSYATKQKLFFIPGHSCRQIFIELKGFTEYVAPPLTPFITPFSVTTAATYGECLAACRADHKCLSLKYNVVTPKCLLYNTIPYHNPEEPKTAPERDFRTVVLQCGNNICFVRRK